MLPDLWCNQRYVYESDLSKKIGRTYLAYDFVSRQNECYKKQGAMRLLLVLVYYPFEKPFVKPCFNFLNITYSSVVVAVSSLSGVSKVSVFVSDASSVAASSVTESLPEFSVSIVELPL